MHVRESPFFLWVGAWPSAACGHHPGSPAPRAHRHTRTGTGVSCLAASALLRSPSHSGGPSGKEGGELGSRQRGGLAPGQWIPGEEVQQDSEQGSHDGDAAAHEGDVRERHQQLCREWVLGQLLWEGRGAGGQTHGNASPRLHRRDLSSPPLQASLSHNPHHGPGSNKVMGGTVALPSSNSHLPFLCESLPSLTVRTHHVSHCVCTGAPLPACQSPPSSCPQWLVKG